jgi:hypothetical protein
MHFESTGFAGFEGYNQCLESRRRQVEVNSHHGFQTPNSSRHPRRPKKWIVNNMSNRANVTNLIPESETHENSPRHVLSQCINSRHQILHATYPAVPKVHCKKDNDYDSLFQVLQETCIDK